MRWAAPLLFLLYFNALFTFENVPSTPAMRLAARISIELLVLLAALAASKALGWKWTRVSRAALAVLIFLATLVRYFEITALGVLGREFDLHGDFPHLHRVFAMFWEALSLSSGLLISGGVFLVVALAVGLNWVGLRALERAFEDPRIRRAAWIGSTLGAVLYVAGPTKVFAYPVSAIIAKQLGSLNEGESVELVEIDPPHERSESNLEGLGRANVFLIFLESYGVTLLEDEHHFERIAPRYRSLERNLEVAGYHFASSQIHSPTFGGGSWRAHASLLSGFHAESEHHYNALLASERPTLIHALKARGYRAVAAEPGIKWYWPDGEFYDFDRIYDFETLDYDGPAMGWWKIPDQFTLYRIYKEEIRDARQPLFAKFSLIMTHIPYYPVPAYVEDWFRFDDGTAYDDGLKSVAHDAYRNMRELSSWYVDAFRYELDVLEGFLIRYVPDDSLVVIVGDHQPPKLVTHDNDSWAVPIHVLSKREELVDRFRTIGFEDGLVPLTPSAFRMADFFPRFLELYHVPADESLEVDE